MQFDASYLKEKLKNTAQNNSDGYWKIEQNLPNGNKGFDYIFLAKNNVVFSSSAPISLSSVIKTLKNYVPNLRSANALKVIQDIQEHNNGDSILLLLSKLTLKTEIVNYHKFAEAIKLQILEDFDQYLFDATRRVEFVVDEEMPNKRPIVGFKLDELIQLAQQRRAKWQQIKPWIPSEHQIVSCNTQNPVWQKITVPQQQQIQKLVGQNQTLGQIRYDLGEDRLKLAQTLANLAQKGLVCFGDSMTPVTSSFALEPTKQKVAIGAASKTTTARAMATTHAFRAATSKMAPEIIVIDDSPLLLKSFQAIVSSWGYRIRCCQNGLKSLEIMLASPPAVIFLDINMPQISGFQLMKQIRLQPQLSLIPIVILTAEKSLINQQRAKWSRSIFLTKPLHSDQIATFELKLKTILEKIAPISSEISKIQL